MKVKKQCYPANKVVFRRKRYGYTLAIQLGYQYSGFPKCRYFHGAILISFVSGNDLEKMHAHPRSLFSDSVKFIKSKIDAISMNQRFLGITT